MWLTCVFHYTLLDISESPLTSRLKPLIPHLPTSVMVSCLTISILKVALLRLAI